MELSRTPTKNKKLITTTDQVFLKALCQITVAVPTRAAGLIEVFPHNKTYACMTAELDMYLYPKRPFYITISNFDRVVVHPPKHQKLGEVVNLLVEIVCLEEEGSSHTCRAQANDYNSTMNDLL